MNMSELLTKRPPLILKEYGRNVQKLVNYLTTIEDKEQRTRYAYTIVELMKQVNPQKETTENSQKLWDDLYIMSDFKLDVDGPFPKPDKAILSRKPKKLDYNLHRIKYKHYGHNIQLMIDKVAETTSEEEKRAVTIYIGKLMKSFYGIWNKENIDDAVIIENIRELSGGKLDISVDEVRENNLFDATFKEKPRNGKPKRPQHTGKGKRKN